MENKVGCPHVGKCSDEGEKCDSCIYGAKRSYYEPLPDPNDATSYYAYQYPPGIVLTGSLSTDTSC